MLSLVTRQPSAVRLRADSMHECLTRIAGVQATIMTDPETADRTYIGPMTPELVEEIIAKVGHANINPVNRTNCAW